MLTGHVRRQGVQVLHLRVNTHAELKLTHWLPIRKRSMFKIPLLTFKCMQDCSLLYLSELLVKPWMKKRMDM